MSTVIFSFISVQQRISFISHGDTLLMSINAAIGIESISTGRDKTKIHEMSTIFRRNSDSQLSIFKAKEEQFLFFIFLNFHDINICERNWKMSWNYFEKRYRVVPVVFVLVVVPVKGPLYARQYRRCRQYARWRSYLRKTRRRRRLRRSRRSRVVFVLLGSLERDGDIVFRARSTIAISRGTML